MKNEHLNRIDRLAKFFILLGILGNIAGIGLVTAGMNAGLIVIAVSWLAEIFPAFHLHMKRGLREAAEYRKTRRIEANTGMD